MMDEFGLNEEDCELVVTDEHLEEFSRCYGENWKKVTAYLELKSIVFKDIDRKNVDEGEKRFTFFTEWKILKSSSATYEKLVSAFLKIGDRDDAEALCKMLKSSIDKDPSIRGKYCNLALCQICKVRMLVEALILTISLSFWRSKL